MKSWSSLGDHTGQLAAITDKTGGVYRALYAQIASDQRG